MSDPDKIDWYRTSFGEAEAASITKALRDEHVSQGPVTTQLEELIKHKLGVPYAVVTTSGSVALLMSLMALGVGPGDEVIVPNRTWIATAHAALILGARIRLVDVVEDKPCLNCELIEEVITAKTKAIIPVHLNGRSVDMLALTKIASAHKIPVVEDACQAFLSKNIQGYLGTQSEIGCFSFGVTKLVATGQGGAMVTFDKALYQKLCLIRTHGTTSNIHAAYSIVGCNFKFSDLLAAIGIVQLDKAESHIKHVKKVYQTYQSGLANSEGIRIIPVNLEAGEIPLYVEVMLSNRAALISYLEKNQISTRPFLPNVNSAPYLAQEQKRIFKNSDKFCEQGLFLPCGPTQSIENVHRVIKAIAECRNL